MPDLIDSVADFTDLRDQDDLETALTKIVFHELRATELRLWRVVGRDGDIRLRRQVELPENVDFSRATPEVPLGDQHAELRRCYETRTEFRRDTDATGLSTHFFPVSDGKDVLSVLEVKRLAPLSDAQANLAGGLLRIYCNYRGILKFSERDELTGLLNRRTFSEYFKRVVAVLAADASAEKRRQAGTAAQAHLAVIDIDFFKRINDEFGHPYGDEVLVLLARIMGDCFREHDRLFRFGGEEFLVVLPETDLHRAERALERFRESVETFNFSQVGRVTVSIGFTALQAGDSGPDAFGRADQALYVAKHRGRNQVQCHEMLIDNGSLVSAVGHDQDVELF